MHSKGSQSVDDEVLTAMAATLSASFALVKPAGMTPKETKDWIRVACGALQHLPFHIFEAGARDARLTCTHHSQIVPTIVAGTKEALAWHNRPRVAPLLRLVSPEYFAPDEPLPDPETLMPSLKRIGLLKGWLVELSGGRLAWAPDEKDNSRARPG